MEAVKSIILAGVGGQGTILVSKILTQGLVEAGYDVKMSEIHGMAQRGGSVSTQVRYGREVHSPIIGLGAADILVAFEKMEAVRYAPFLKPGGIAIINNYEIMPLPVATGKMTYPSGLIAAMEADFQVYTFDAMATAQRLGNSKTMNVVLFGAMVEAFAMDMIDWQQVLRLVVPPKFITQNIEAFAAGRALLSPQG